MKDRLLDLIVLGFERPFVTCSLVLLSLVVAAYARGTQKLNRILATLPPATPIGAPTAGGDRG